MMRMFAPTHLYNTDVMKVVWFGNTGFNAEIYVCRECGWITQHRAAEQSSVKWTKCYKCMEKSEQAANVKCSQCGTSYYVPQKYRHGHNTGRCNNCFMMAHVATVEALVQMVNQTNPPISVIDYVHSLLSFGEVL